jgi:hypothetical protein
MKRQDASLISKLKIMEEKKAFGHSLGRERMTAVSLVAVSKLRKVVHKSLMESHLVSSIITLMVSKISLNL